MLGMGEGLKLSNLRASPFGKACTWLPCSPGNLSQKMGLREEALLAQPNALAYSPQLGEVDVGSQVLLSGIREQIVGSMVMGVGPQCASTPFRREELV